MSLLKALESAIYLLRAMMMMVMMMLALRSQRRFEICHESGEHIEEANKIIRYVKFSLHHAY